jgi:hypothetical protein
LSIVFSTFITFSPDIYIDLPIKLLFNILTEFYLYVIYSIRLLIIEPIKAFIFDSFFFKYYALTNEEIQRILEISDQVAIQANKKEIYLPREHEFGEVFLGVRFIDTSNTKYSNVKEFYLKHIDPNSQRESLFEL